MEPKDPRVEYERTREAVAERDRLTEERERIDRIAEQGSVDPIAVEAAMCRRHIRDASRLAVDARRLERTHPAA